MSYLTAFLFLTVLTGFLINKNNFYKAQKEFKNIIEKENRKQLESIQQSFGKNKIIV